MWKRDDGGGNHLTSEGRQSTKWETFYTDKMVHAEQEYCVAGECSSQQMVWPNDER